MSLCYETSWASLNKFGEELCGDKVEILKAGGDTFMVLADGLGSGVKASILSSLTSKIVITMLAAGAELRDVIETMADTLPVCKVREVAYSTFTILRLSPNGNAYLVEFDNPELVLLRHGVSMPILREEKTIGGKLIREARFQLEAGDICVFFSDGVIHAGVGKLLNLGWQHQNVVQYLEKFSVDDATAFSTQSLLLSACNSLYMDEPGDDTTVAACKARIPNTAFVMVGPPVDPNYDVILARQLLEWPGTKVVCGGTTSQIVSRVAKKPVKASLDYLSRDVPPTGTLEGVDLVTEGVITLGKTLELIKRYEIGAIGRENMLQSGRDGAYLLAQALILQCTGARFVVGRALNPAHQNPDLPLSLGIKLKLVDEIATHLRLLGKEVTVEYF